MDGCAREGGEMKTGRTAVVLAVLLVASGIVAYGQTWVTTTVDPGVVIMPPLSGDAPYDGDGHFTFTPWDGWSLWTVEVYWQQDASLPRQLVQKWFCYGPKERSRDFDFGPGIYEIVAHARAGIWYMLAVDKVGPGSVTLVPPGEPVPPFNYAVYLAGTTVTLTVDPDPGCAFVGWSGDATGTDRQLYVTLDGLWAAEATFIEDATPPADPVVTSSSHAVGVPSNNPNVVIEVAGAYDAESGVDGYEVAWDQSATWVPSHTKTNEETWSGETFIATADGAWYFHLATVDNAGNWTAGAHLGPFSIDTTPPELIGCPGDATWYAAPRTTSALVYWTPPSVTDNLDLHPSLEASAASGDEFPLGDSVVTYEASDHAGNTTSYSFTVAVLAQPAPFGSAEKLVAEFDGAAYTATEVALIVNAANQVIADGAPSGVALSLVRDLIRAGVPADQFVKALERFAELTAAGMSPGDAKNEVLGKKGK